LHPSPDPMQVGATCIGLPFCHLNLVKEEKILQKINSTLRYHIVFGL
jgi:sulfite reductase beta subunit-like hemoprotein